jgi:hypothetical protein
MTLDVISSLKCPLTLQTFEEPYSNKKCKHSKSSYIRLVLRQVKRQEAQAAVELEDDLVDVVPATQRNKPRDNDSRLV